MHPIDKISGEETAIHASMRQVEESFRGGIFTIEKFIVDKYGDRISGTPDDVIQFRNLYTNAGGVALLNLLIGAGGTAFNNANAHIGVGDSLTAAAVAQTDLQATTNKLRKAMIATFPSLSGQTMAFKSTFLAAEANHAWNEIGLFNASSVGTMMCRALVTSPFTKTAGLAIDATYSLVIP